MPPREARSAALVLAAGAVVQAQLSDRFAVRRGPIKAWPGYRTLCDLRMITTNARKSIHEPDKMRELLHRIEGLRQEDFAQRWNIM